MKRAMSTFLMIQLAAALSGCSDPGPLVVTIDGREIHYSEIERRSSELASGAVDEHLYLNALTKTIYEAIIEDVVATEAREEFGIEATGEEVDAKFEELKAKAAGYGTFEEEIALEGYTIEGFREAAALEVVFDELRIALAPQLPEVTYEEIEAFYQEHLKWFVESACIEIIQTETESEIEAVKARLDGGEEFGVLAREVSIHTVSAANGGSMGCGPLQYSEDFAEKVTRVREGTVSEPFASGNAFNLIRVTERKIRPIESVATEIETTINDEAMVTILSDWIIEQLTDSDIVLASEYGTWEAGPPPQVRPPVAVAIG